MAEAGILTEDERLEMIDGDILMKSDRTYIIEGDVVTMSPIGSRHSACVDRLNALAHGRRSRDRAIVRIQSPIRLNDRSRAGARPVAPASRGPISTRRPIPARDDVFSVIEVMDSSADSRPRR